MYFYIWYGLLFFTHAKQIVLEQQSSVALEDYPYSAGGHESVTLTFDDLPDPPNGLSSLPVPYPDETYPIHLKFKGFSLFRPDHPALSHLISENDLNCAVSSPHAVLGSRYQASPLLPSTNGIDGEENELKIASFELASSSDDGGASTTKTSFELRSLSIKPMDFPSGAETRLFFHGYKSAATSTATSAAEVAFNISFPAGYHLPLHLDMEETSNGKSWTDLGKVEIWADYGRDDNSGYEGLDWEFCIDDLSLIV